jgi:haloacetate dehalogenase
MAFKASSSKLETRRSGSVMVVLAPPSFCFTAILARTRHWNKVAPLLADRHYVVCPDLRGYGRSSKPPTTPNHAPYSKRSMASEMVSLMRDLGHERFMVVGHDRGVYVAFRMAMDHPGAVERLTIMDAVPIGDALAHCGAKFASRWWRWFFLGQTSKPAERLINADPDAWYQATPDDIGPEAYADLRSAIHDPETVYAMCEDYRAGLGIDREHDDHDRTAGRRIACPLMFVRASLDDLGDLYDDPVAIWRDWADEVQSRVLDCGHHMAEEAPDELAELLLEFARMER